MMIEMRISFNDFNEESPTIKSVLFQLTVHAKKPFTSQLKYRYLQPQRIEEKIKQKRSPY